VWAVTATPTIGSSMKLYSKILPALLLLILVVAFVVRAGVAQVNLPEELLGTRENISIAGSVIGFGNWKTMSYLASKDEEISKCRVYGFTQQNNGKPLDVIIDDAKMLLLLKNAISTASCFRPAVADLEPGDGAAGGGDFLGVMVIESKEHKCIIGVSYANGFSCGVAYGSGKTMFYSWPLMTLLKEWTGSHGIKLSDDIFDCLSGEKAFKNSKSNFVELSKKIREVGERRGGTTKGAQAGQSPTE
jgi:hypothetical protein